MLGHNWQIYTYMPGIRSSERAVVSAEESQKNSSLPPFLQKALESVADKFNTTYDKSRDNLDSSVFYMDIGYNEDSRTIYVYSFGLKDRDNHNSGIGKDILQAFFKAISAYATKEVAVTLWSVTTAIGFYLRCGMSIQAVEDTYINPVEMYYKRKAELFGDDWDKYRLDVCEKLPKDEIDYETIYNIYKESDFYQEGDHPGIFSVWIEDVMGDRAHHMIKYVEPNNRRNAGNSV